MRNSKCENLTDAKAVLEVELGVVIGQRRMIKDQATKHLYNKRIRGLKTAIIVVDQHINLKRMEGDA